MPVLPALNDGLSEKSDRQNERKNISNELSIFLIVKHYSIAILRALRICIALLNDTKKTKTRMYWIRVHSFVISNTIVA